ncbi:MULTISPECIES: hypothetical protein [Bacteria]|uniref:hypothetical protein n=1 Tax=Bacteria TaxID=2 RepID=UPI0007D7F4F0
MTFEENGYFGIYELQQYAVSRKISQVLKNERDFAIEDLYDDISPSITGVDYDIGQFYVLSTRPDTMAIKIIETKEKYTTMINKEERKATLFEKALELLTDRELQVVQVAYHGRKNDLGLSPDYLYEILIGAQSKLCAYLGNERSKQLDAFEEQRKAELRRRVKA